MLRSTTTNLALSNYDPPDIAISFALEGNWSKVGTDSREEARWGRASMSLADVAERTTIPAIRHVVLHEFGHALGFKHEHQRPDAGIPWDKEAVYKAMAELHNWDKAKVDANIFGALDVSSFNSSQWAQPVVR